jgi:hypothetical protein
MAYAYTAQANNGASASGLTLTCNFTVSVGDAVIEVWGSFSGALTSLALSDGTHTYPQAGSAGSVASTLTHRIASYYVLAPTPGNYTLTMTLGGTRANRRLAVVTHQGVTAFQTSNNQGQLAAATTANAVTTGSMTPTSQPAMMAALSFTASGTATYSAGTGHTSRGNLSNWDAIGSFSSLIEDIRLTSTSPVSGLFTISASQDTLSSGMVFTEAPAASVSPSGIASAEALGTPTVTFRAALAATGIASAQAFGTSIFSNGAAVIRRIRRGIGLRGGIWL